MPQLQHLPISILYIPAQYHQWTRIFRQLSGGDLFCKLVLGSYPSMIEHDLSYLQKRSTVVMGKTQESANGLRNVLL